MGCLFFHFNKVTFFLKVDEKLEKEKLQHLKQDILVQKDSAHITVVFVARHGWMEQRSTSLCWPWRFGHLVGLWLSVPREVSSPTNDNPGALAFCLRHAWTRTIFLTGSFLSVSIYFTQATHYSCMITSDFVLISIWAQKNWVPMAMILAPGMHPSAGSTVGSHTFPRVKIDPGAQIRCFDPWAIWRFPLLNDFFGSATSFGAFNFGSCFVWRHSLQFDQPFPPCQVLKDSFVGANCRTVRDTQPLRLCSSQKKRL